MDTDRHRPATDCRTMNFYADPVATSIEKQSKPESLVQQNRSQSQFKFPFLERIALFTAHKVHDVVKLSHVDQHFQEFAQFYSVKVFRNLVLINDTRSFLDHQQDKEERNADASETSPSSSSPFFLFRPSPGISSSSKNNNNNNNNNRNSHNSHIEDCLNCIIQPISRTFISYSRTRSNQCIGDAIPSPVSWLVDLITAAGFFGYGSSRFAAFSREFARLPIHRAITYGHKEVVRLMLRRSFEMEKIFTATCEFEKNDDSGSFCCSSVPNNNTSLPDPIQTTLLCQDSTGSTILHYAVQLKQESIVAMILEYCFKLDRNISQHEKRKDKWKTKKDKSSIPRAATSVTALLLGAVDDQGCNVFHAEARRFCRNPTILKLLLQSLASVDKFFGSSKSFGEANDHDQHPLFAKNFTKKETPLETAKSFFNEKAISILSLEMKRRRGEEGGEETPKSAENDDEEDRLEVAETTTKRNYENDNDQEGFIDSSDDDDDSSTLEEISNHVRTNNNNNNESDNDDDVVGEKVLQESKSEEEGNSGLQTTKNANVEDDLMSDDDEDAIEI